MKFRSVSSLLSRSSWQCRESAQWPGPTQLNTALLHLAERQKERLAVYRKHRRSLVRWSKLLMRLLSFSETKNVAGWSDGGRRCVSTSRRPPPLLLSSLLAVIPSLLCSLVKDSSLRKFNQTAWIKAITQFVYKASFILCQASAPLTICGLLTPDLCWGHMMHLLRSSTRGYYQATRG